MSALDLAAPVLAVPGAGAVVEVSVQGLRSAKGAVLLCVTADPASFPDCSADRNARRLTVPAARSGVVRIDGLPPGTYAVALFHDENGNGRLDKFAGIPREGIGFSNNPRMRFGPPSFAQASLTLSGNPAAIVVRMRYFL